MVNTRKQHDAEFKARVGFKAVKVDMKMVHLASDVTVVL